MSKPVLYLMLGYPGSGKTTAAKVIHELTGAVHLWADHIRRERYGQPTYTHQENLELYSHLNELADELLAADNSVIYDTSFNFYKDRQLLREIARSHKARNILVWVKTDRDLARQRATQDTENQPTRVLGDMPRQRFEYISRRLESPRSEENTIELDGTKITPKYIRTMLRGFLT